MQVKDITSEGPVSGLFLILDSQWRVAKNGNPFAAMRLGDKTGEIFMKVWEISQQVFAELQKGRVISVEATARNFNGVLQLEADGKERFFRVCAGGEYDPALFLRTTPTPTERLWQVLDDARKEVDIEPYRELLDHFFGDEGFRKEFAGSPAALRRHHVYRGGLLEHTAGVVTLCRAAAGYYPRVNKALLFTGALLHDLGKVRTYSSNPGFEGTDEGRLIGHLVLSVRMVTKAVEKLREVRGLEFFPPDLELPLIHLLVSHHGIMEWGSPVEPVLLEACLLHHADYMDAEVSKFEEVIRRHPEDGGKWTSFDQNLKRAVYLPYLNWEVSAAEENPPDGE